MSTTGTFPQYHLIRRLRATPMSQLYEASCGRGAGRFLVEVLDGLVGLPSALAAFERDLCQATSPPHPYVLPVREISCLPDGTPIAVCEWPEGQSLEQWLAIHRGLSLKTAVGLVMALADVLTEMHARGVSHGDLTAEHVYLVEREGCSVGLPRLQGFGFGWLRATSDKTSDVTGAVAGIRRQDRQKGRRIGSAERLADLAALGALAGRLLAAAEWAEGGSEEDAALAMTGERRRVSAVLARALHPSVTEGYATPLSFALALEAALAPAETMVLAAIVPGAVPALRGLVPAKKVSPDQREDDELVPARNSRLPLAAAATAAVALVVGLLAWAPAVSGQGRVHPPQATAAVTAAEPLPEAPLVLAAAMPAAETMPDMDMGTGMAQVPAMRLAHAFAPTPLDATAEGTPARAARTRSLPRAKRGVLWSARLGRVVAVQEDVEQDVEGDATGQQAPFVPTAPPALNGSDLASEPSDR